MILPEEYVDTEDWIRKLRRKRKEAVKIVKDDEVKKRSSILVIDTDIGLDLALGLARKGADVYYFVEHRALSPKIEHYISGYGFPEIKKVRDYGDALTSVDTVMFIDVGFGALADYLRGNGVNVFGSSAKGELLELDRTFMFKTFEELGIAIPEYKIVRGVSGVVEYVRKFEGGDRKFWIKLNRFRGNQETFCVKTAKEAEAMLSQANFSVMAGELDFVITRNIDGAEMGIDLFFDGKEFLRPYHLGNELKNIAAEGKWVEASIWDEGFLDKIEPWLANTGYKGTFSMEAIFDGSSLYCLDATCRFPFPVSGVYPRNITNFVDVITNVAGGEAVQPIPMAHYDMEIELYVDASTIGKWRPIEIDDDVRHMVALPRAVFVNGELWWVPGNDLFASAVGIGNTFTEAFNMAEYTKRGISGMGVYSDAGVAMKLDELNRKLKEFGINW